MSWTYEAIFVSIIAVGLVLFDFPLEQHCAESILCRLDTRIQIRVKIGRVETISAFV